MTAHFPLGPSSAHRWIPCPGSYQLSKGLDTSSVAAEEGTAAHEVSELLLKDDKPGDMAGEHPYVYDDPEERFFLDYDFIMNYVDYVHSWRKKSSQMWVEMRADFGRFIPGGYGTADAVILTGRQIDVIDLKYGLYVQVDAEENEQLALYGLGVWDTLKMIAPDDITKIRLHIMQPRRDHISVWETTPERLVQIGFRAKAAAELAFGENPPFNPGEKQCSFCPAGREGICRAKNEADLENAKRVFEIAGREDLGGHDLEEMAKLHLGFKGLKTAMSRIEEALLHRALNGEHVPYHKLAKGRRVTYYRDPEYAEERLAERFGDDKVYQERKLKTPAQVRALWPTPKAARSSEFLAELVDRTEGSMKLVPETDSRPEEYVASVDDLFADVEVSTEDFQEDDLIGDVEVSGDDDLIG